MHDPRTESFADLILLAESGDFLAAKDVVENLAWAVADSDMPKFVIDYLCKALFEISLRGADANRAFHLGKHQAWSTDQKRLAVDIVAQIRSKSLKRGTLMSVAKAARIALPAIKKHALATELDASAYEAARASKTPVTPEISAKAIALVSPWRSFVRLASDGSPCLRSLSAKTLEIWYADLQKPSARPNPRRGSP